MYLSGAELKKDSYQHYAFGTILLEEQSRRAQTRKEQDRGANNLCIYTAGRNPTSSVR
jgi:hypothetical protein